MKTPPQTPVLLLALAASALLPSLLFGGNRVEIAVAPSISDETRTFAVTYTARVPELPSGTQRLRLWLPVPQSSALQEITDLTFTSPPRFGDEPKYGNRVAFWEIDHPRAGDQVTMRFTCTRHEVRTDFARVQETAERPSAQFAVFRQPTRFAIVNDRVRQLSAEITTGKTSTVEKARAIYDYVLAHMRYDKSQPGWGRGSTAFACDAGRGNCTDFHSLFNSLARARGLATAFEIGLYLPYERASGEPLGGYHCWTSFHVPGAGWVPVDCSEASRHPERRSYFFGGQTDNRVTFSIGRDIDLVPHQRGPALNYFIDPYAEADGEPVAASKTWSFRDIEPPARVAAY